jgi:hypothetical protein
MILNNLPFSSSNFLLYTAPFGKIKVEVFVEGETVQTEGERQVSRKVDS